MNELKRSNGTCDILSNSNEDDVKCTRSLRHFGPLTQAVFSYNAKLHNSSIWSQALGRVAERPRSRKDESTSSSIFQVESELSQMTKSTKTYKDVRVKAIRSVVTLNKSTYAKTVSSNSKSLQNIPSTRSSIEESHSKICISSNTQTPQKNEEKHHLTKNFKDMNSNSLRTKIDLIEATESQDTPSETKPKSSKTLIDEQKVQVEMDVKTIQNEQGFPLLKYDMKSTGDHVVNSESVVEDFTQFKNDGFKTQTPTSNESEEQPAILLKPPRVLSENTTTTEYEMVNLAQVDLFREFKTTISKMRNVLNVLDHKKSLQAVMDNTLVEKKVRRCSSETFAAENISTQTARMAFNQISTSTDGGCNQTRNEGIMVQLSSETTSKRISINQNALNQLKTPNKIKRRKKRGYRCKSTKLSKKGTNNASSGQDGKSKKPHYHKCVVYHITQHKNAIDRCVGTPCPTSKDTKVLKNTFSALHFGPIKEFPMLLNKHENEKKRSEMDAKIKMVIPDKEQNDIRRRSTSYLSSEPSKIFNQNQCHKSRTQPSLNYVTTNDSTNSETTANWFVFNPSPPVVVKGQQSTNSTDIVLDKNRSSTQELVSNILQEEFKTSGLKGRISSSTMNMIKDQFCDKLNGVKRKDVPDVMITVCVPLKSIVSKIKTSKKPVGDVLPPTGSVDSNLKLPTSSSFDKSIQVNVSKNYVNDNLQTIPEKMSRKSSEIYLQNKMVRESMSSKRLSTFKKIFGNKATSCCNINPFGNLAPKSSKIYFSDHSTSSPDFAPKPIEKESVNVINKKFLGTPKSSSLSVFREEFGSDLKKRRGSFFLNLPRNRFRKKREQISRLFNYSDSSCDKRYFAEPKLLYHIHESSFYSSSRTDEKFSSGPMLLESSTSQEKIKTQFFPVQQTPSRVDFNQEPKSVSFSDLPKSCKSQVFTPEKIQDKPCKEEGIRKLKPILKNAKVNTSTEKVFRDNETQFENEVCDPVGDAPKEQKSARRKNKKTEDADSFFNNRIDEFSVSLAKVHFEDEGNGGNMSQIVENVRERYYESKETQDNKDNPEKQKTFHDQLKNNPSILSLFADDEKTSEKATDVVIVEQQQQVDKIIEAKVEIEEKPKKKHRHKNQSHVILQTSSESNTTQMGEGDHDTVSQCTVSTSPATKKHKCKQSRDIVKVESTQVDSVTSLPKMENFLVQVEAPKNESRLTGLIRDVVNLCNSSFVKSRDCIVELTLYNLIKEIILEHCSHLSEQSRQKVESILANFMTVSKQKVGNDNVDIVESAIENLVKEIGPTESPCPIKQPIDEELVEYMSDLDKKREHKHRRKYSRSKSKRREHKHESKHRSRRREYECEKKHHHREGEKRRRSKRHHKHHCDLDDECEIGKLDSEEKFRTVDGKKEYLALVHRLKELEAVTKQLSHVAHNKDDRKNTKVYTTSIVEKADLGPKKKMKFSLSQLETIGLGKEFQKEPVNINFFQTDNENPILSIPRNYPKLPVTKIVINLSNLKLLTRNCASLASTSANDPLVITDSTEDKQKLIRKIVSYQTDNGHKTRIRHSSRHLAKIEKNRSKGSGIINKNKESFTITIHGKDKKKTNYSKEILVKSSKDSKDVMKIKMVRKKKVVTSASDQTASESYSSKKYKEETKLKNIQQITKEYIKREYKLNSDLLCTSLAKELLSNKCNMDDKGNLDMAYQRMANFCLFRGLLKKESNCD